MKKFKVLTVLGTRPEIIRLSRIIYKFDKSFDHILVNTNQNFDYNLNKVFFKDLDIRKPDYNLKSAGSTSIQTISKVLIDIEKIILKEKPDAFFILGDTNSSYSLLVAKKYKIPTFHYEAGNRCFDMRVPEELNRKLIDTISDINLTYSESAKNFLIKEGFPINRILKIGSPMKEVINFYKDKILSSKILQKQEIKKNKYILISFHREENLDYKNNLNNFITLLKKLIKLYKLSIIISTHPRTRKKLNKFIKINKNNKNILFLKPLSFSDYNNLQINSALVLSDSGTINEETSILKFLSINLRENTERHEAMEESITLMSSLDVNRILTQVNYLINNKDENLNINEVKDYEHDNVSEKIVRTILSYTSYINREVWKK
jgi:UDP-N-acetylglucosamine 2-epimerase (non-hydrolysing)